MPAPTNEERLTRAAGYLRLLSEPVYNDDMGERVGRSVLMIEVLPVVAGQTLRVAFQGTSGSWRQGVWMAVDGELEVDGVRAAQMELWTDTAPPAFDVTVVRAGDGFLRFYNIWDSGRGRRKESQSATSGMLKEQIDGGTVYRCNDIGYSPAFDRLVFELRDVTS